MFLKNVTDRLLEARQKVLQILDRQSSQWFSFQIFQSSPAILQVTYYFATTISHDVCAEVPQDLRKGFVRAVVSDQGRLRPPEGRRGEPSLLKGRIAER